MQMAIRTRNNLEPKDGGTLTLITQSQSPSRCVSLALLWQAECIWPADWPNLFYCLRARQSKGENSMRSWCLPVAVLIYIIKINIVLNKYLQLRHLYQTAQINASSGSQCSSSCNIIRFYCWNENHNRCFFFHNSHFLMLRNIYL